MSLTITEIKNILSTTDYDGLPEVLDGFRADERSGVIKLIKQFENKYSAHLAELKRLEEITMFEKDLYSKGYKLIAGIDEVGRGPLAGPVVTAAVILPVGCKIEGVNDSKKLTEKKRELLFDEICEKAEAYCFRLFSAGSIRLTLPRSEARSSAQLQCRRHRRRSTCRTGSAGACGRWDPTD